MNARCCKAGAVVNGVISTRRTGESHGGPRRSFRALRANYSSSVALRGSPFFLRVESLGMPVADTGDRVVL